MKKLVTFAVTLLLVASLAAQEGQEKSPTMWIGGEVTFGSFSNRDFTLGPSWGLMLGENIGAGVTLIFSAGNDSYFWDLEPYFRYYIPIIDKFAFYGDAFVGIGGGDNATDIDGGYYTNFDVGARIGLQYWFTTRWSVAASTNVIRFSSNDGTGSFGAGVSFNSVNFSLFWHF